MHQPLIASRRGALLIAAGGALAPLLVAPRAFAQAAAAQGSEEEYMILMSEAGTFTKTAAQIGLEKAQDEAARQFAELEIAEIDAVMAVLGAAGAPPPPEMLEGEKAQRITQLQEVQSGPDFDRLFVETQIAGHEEGLQIQQLLLGQPPSTLPVATATLADPAIRSHLATLQMIQQMMA